MRISLQLDRLLFECVQPEDPALLEAFFAAVRRGDVYLMAADRSGLTRWVQMAVPDVAASSGLPAGMAGGVSLPGEISLGAPPVDLLMPEPKGP